jgi:hypothetical protein
MLYLGPIPKCSLRALAARVTYLASEASLIDADQSIGLGYVSRVIAEVLASDPWGARSDPIAGNRPLPKPTRS